MSLDPMTLRFAFLVLEEHPYGREMLRILLERGLLPGLIIEEVSEVATKERQKFLTRIAGQPVPPRAPTSTTRFLVGRLGAIQGSACRFHRSLCGRRD